MDYVFYTPWHDVLPREAGHVVACAGGAGKSALLAAVAGVYAADGIGLVRCGPGQADPGEAAVVLADADGPATVPLRPGPAPTAWPERTSLAVLELSVAVVGGRADAAYGPAGLPADLADWTVLGWEHLDAAVQATLDGLPAGVPAVLALTGVEAQPDSIGLFAFAGRVMAAPPLAVVLFCSGGEEGLVIRACCRADGSRG